jgi:hypothetical protein
MIDIDYGPGVGLSIIIGVFLLPALYGLLFVDKYWKEHKQALESESEKEAEDTFA